MGTRLIGQWGPTPFCLVFMAGTLGGGTCQRGGDVRRGTAGARWQPKKPTATLSRPHPPVYFPSTILLRKHVSEIIMDLFVVWSYSASRNILDNVNLHPVFAPVHWMSSGVSRSHSILWTNIAWPSNTSCTCSPVAARTQNAGELEVCECSLVDHKKLSLHWSLNRDDVFSQDRQDEGRDDAMTEGRRRTYSNLHDFKCYIKAAIPAHTQH